VGEAGLEPAASCL